MNRLIVFDRNQALLTDGWRVPADEVADFSDAAALLGRCSARLDAVEGYRQAQLEQASAEGFAAGFADGQASAQRQVVAQLDRLLEALSIERAENRAAVGRLAMDIVRRLLGDIDVERSIELFVAQRFEDLRDEQPLALRVSRGRAAGVERLLGDRNSGVRVIEDLALAGDECVFELASGSARAALSIQLEALDAMVSAVEGELVCGSAHVA